jgi:hypothetical protein
MDVPLATTTFHRRTAMPIFVIPAIIGGAVLLGGGYWIIHSMH